MAGQFGQQDLLLSWLRQYLVGANKIESQFGVLTMASSKFQTLLKSLKAFEASSWTSKSNNLVLHWIELLFFGYLLVPLYGTGLFENIYQLFTDINCKNIFSNLPTFQNCNPSALICILLGSYYTYCS